MKINTFKHFKFTADLWTFTTTLDSQGGEIKHYTFNRNISLRAATSTAGRLFVFFKETEGDVVVDCQLANFKDANGVVMRPGGVYILSQVEPSINVYGVREGFKGVAQYWAIDSIGV